MVLELNALSSSAYIITYVGFSAVVQYNISCSVYNIYITNQFQTTGLLFRDGGPYCHEP
jgi:hypothetical protein